MQVVSLENNQSGIGYTSKSCDINENILYLKKGHALNFPKVRGGDYFFINIFTCNKNLDARVVKLEDDKMYVEYINNCLLKCVPSNSKITYDFNSKEYIQSLASELPLYTRNGLVYDKNTRILSMDYHHPADNCDCHNDTNPTFSELVQQGVPKKKNHFLKRLLNIKD